VIPTTTLRPRRDEQFIKAVLRSSACDIVASQEVTIFEELRVARHRPDLVLVNGSTCALEVKSQYDNSWRLGRQLDEYLRVFDTVYLVCESGQIERFARLIPQHVGIISLTGDTCSIAREGKPDHERLDHRAIFVAMRRSEHLRVAKERFGHEPKVPNTLIFEHCFELFSQLGRAEASDELRKSLLSRPEGRLYISAVDSPGLRGRPE